MLLVAGCGAGDGPSAAPPSSTSRPTSSASAEAGVVDGVFDIGGGRGLYLRCSGAGAPTLVLEGGDDDTSDSYAYAESDLAGTTRTCVYDRANLGRSDPAPAPRELDDYVSDLEKLLAAARVDPPYVLVGTSGGGHLAAGYAVAHPGDVAGMVFVDTAPPLDDPPKEIVKATRPTSPENVEKRDYLQIERDAWASRTRIGDIPLVVISVQFSADEIAAAEFPAEQGAMRRNVARQRGWFVLSPRARQVVTHGGHAVEATDAALVVRTIQGVVEDARRSTD
jgi:pimeloyl-ACP methyl ester carboxylesterase